MDERESPTGGGLARWVECLTAAERAIAEQDGSIEWAINIILFYGMQQLPPHRHTREYMEGVVRDLLKKRRSNI